VSTPYRNEIDALRERKTALEAEITNLRDQTTRLDELRAREAELARELAGVDVRLNAGAPKRALPLLDQVRVASPCTADWNEMLGDERVRFCLSCEKNVFNLSSMTRDDAEDLLREKLGDEVCVRFYQRADGTILTQDCPTGVKKKRRKKLALAVAGAGAMAAAAATMFMKGTCTQGEYGPVAGAAVYEGEPRATMGEVEPAPVPSVMGTATPHVVEPPDPGPRVTAGRMHIAPLPPSAGTAPKHVPPRVRPTMMMGKPSAPSR
jgi:hypothetical protein